MVTTMVQKNDLLNLVNKLSDRVAIEDVMEKLLLLAKIEKGCQEADAGKTITHSEAERRMAKWLL